MDDWMSGSPEFLSSVFLHAFVLSISLSSFSFLPDFTPAVLLQAEDRTHL